MTALQAITQATTNPSFQARVEYFMVTAAVAVTTESSGTALHSQRIVLAVAIINNPLTYVPSFSIAAMTNATLFAYANVDAIVDNDLQFAINSVFNSFFVH
jgi:hypothetical protein